MSHDADMLNAYRQQLSAIREAWAAFERVSDRDPSLMATLRASILDTTADAMGQSYTQSLSAPDTAPETAYTIFTLTHRLSQIWSALRMDRFCLMRPSRDGSAARLPELQATVSEIQDH